MGGITQPRKLALAVLISGRGSNLKAIIDACRIDDFPAEIKLVISNVPEAAGLSYAKDAGIPTRIVSHDSFATKADFEKELLSALREVPVDLICLAGFMRILTPDFIAAWNGRILNIHPSLLPKHKGLDTHKRALAAGDSETGCTVHHVTADIDSGHIILQRKVPIFSHDTPTSLSARVLEEEHLAYPEAIRIMASQLLCPDSAP